MRKTIFLLTLVLTASHARAAVSWIRDDVDTAFMEAKVRNRPVLAYFHTIWCSWCVELEDKVFSTDEVTDRASAFVPVRINCDREAGENFARKYNVVAFPTILVLTPDKKVVGRLSFFRPAAAFLRFLDECLTPGETIAAVDARIAGGDRSPALLLRSADRHSDALELEIARKRYEEAIAADAGGQAGIADDARMGLAKVKLAARDTAAALEQYRTVLRLYPGSDRLAEAFVGILDILRDENRSDEIDKMFAEYAVRFSDNPAVLNDYARRLLETGKDPALAVRHAKRASERSPDSADYRATLARALLASGRPTEALDAISAAIDLRPTDKDLRVLRLEILEAARKPPVAPK